MNRILLPYLLLMVLPGTVCLAREERVLTLEECLSLSHSNSPEVVNSALDIRAAEARKGEALSAWFPSVSVSAYGFHSLDPLLDIGLEDVLGSGDAANNLRYYAGTVGGLSGLPDSWSLLQHGYMASFNVMQPLFAGGRIANGNALASLGVRAERMKGSIALRANDDQVAEKYWTVVALAGKKEALQQGIDLVAALEKDVLSAVGAGVARESDLLQVRLKGKDLESKMNRLRSGERLAKMDLFNMIGLGYKVLELDGIVLSEGSTDTLKPPQTYYRDESEVVASLDESRLLELSLEARRLEKKMALGEALPQVAVGASVGYGQVIGDPRANGALYAMVKIPLSDWGKTSRRVARCQYEIQKAENDKAYLDKQLSLKVSKEWIDLVCAWEQLETARDAVELSDMVTSQKRGEYAAGLCTLTELLQCQTELQTSISTLVDCEVEYRKAVSVWEK